MKITVVGLGYVGLSLSVLLSRKHHVKVYDINKKKLEIFSRKKIKNPDPSYSKIITNKLNLQPTNIRSVAYGNSKYIIICTPTNYIKSKNKFDTSTVEANIKDILKMTKNVTIIIKSTVPIGFTEKMKKKYKYKNIIFSPEFLRETTSLYDNLFPARIIVGDKTQKAKVFANLLNSCAEKKLDKNKLILMSSSEAEAVKLFSNTYLAMRVAFFNELDSFSEHNSFSTTNLINGVSSDPRIGNFYNNPSFGYGGYCLPKDTKQLNQSFGPVPNQIIKATIDSNKKRKDFITKSIIKKNPKCVGVYLLAMKEKSDNFRESSIIDIIKKLNRSGINVIIFEPSLSSDKIFGVKVENHYSNFIKKCDLIIANRISRKLKSSGKEIYSRDISGKD